MQPLPSLDFTMPLSKYNSLEGLISIQAIYHSTILTGQVSPGNQGLITLPAFAGGCSYLCHKRSELNITGSHLNNLITSHESCKNKEANSKCYYSHIGKHRVCKKVLNLISQDICRHWFSLLYWLMFLNY